MSVDVPEHPPRPPLYPLMRLLGRIILRIFLRHIDIRLRAPVPETGPIVLASNHPNSLLDPLAVIAVTRRPVRFLAKSGLFSFPPIGWALRSFGVLPVYRRSDNPAKMLDNERTFEACHRVLGRGGAIGIFPEGVSHANPEIKQIKTGAVRIALESEEKAGFSLGVRIVPMGLTFPERSRFRSELGIHVGEPIDLAPHLEEYRRDPKETVRRVTGILEERMKHLVLHLDRVELAATVEEVASLYRDELADDLERSGHADEAADRFGMSRAIARAVQHYASTDPEVTARVESAVKAYFGHLRRSGLHDVAVRELDDPTRGTAWIVRLLLLGLVGLPFALYGTVNSFLPWLLTRVLGPRLATDPVDIAERKIYVGMAAFTLFYAGQVTAAWLLLGPRLAAGYAVSLVPTGLFAVRFWRKARAVWRRLWARSLARRRPGLAGKLAARRKALVSTLDELRDRYRAEHV